MRMLALTIDCDPELMGLVEAQYENGAMGDETLLHFTRLAL